MRRLLWIAIAFAALTVAWIPTPVAGAQPPTKRAVIVLAPYLTWADVTPTSTPTIWSLAENGAVGDINARSRTREPGEPASPLEGALTISAGAWAVPSFAAPAAFVESERYEVGTAAEAFQRTTGEQVGDNRIVFLGMPMTQRLNAERSIEVVLGILGDTVEGAGGLTAAVGNSDVGYVTAEQRRVRPAAMAAMNSKGLVALGDISPKLIREDPNAPFGIETDVEQFAEALREVDAATAAAPGPALVVLDAGDAYRATKFEPQVSPAIAEEQRRRALTTLDRVVALAAEQFADDTIMVVSQSSGDALINRPEGLGPVVVAGEGWSGYLTSNSTQREGLVTNLDVTATVLEVLGLERPVQVLGNEMRVTQAPPELEDRVEHLSRMDATAVSVDAAKPGIVNSFVVLTVIVLLLGAFVLVRSHHWSARTVRSWVLGLRLALLAVVSVPVASWLMFSWMRWPQSAGESTMGLLATAAVVLGFAVILLVRFPVRVPIAALSLLTALTIMIDQLLGAPASFTNTFGYSPLLAARFYGMGNEAAAILVGSSLVGVALLFDQWPASRWTRWGKRYGLPLLGIAVTATAAAPFWGANIGVAVWGVAGFGLAWVLMNGRHVTARTIVWLALSVVAVIAAFAAVDLLGGGAQTHLARAISSAQQGGWVELWNIVARKAETNMRVLTHTNWAYILVATLAFLGFMRWRPQGGFAETLEANPNFADAITVSLAAGLVAYFSEDSGIVIPALEVFYVGVAIVWLMLARLDSSDSTERDVGDDAETSTR